MTSFHSEASFACFERLTYVTDVNEKSFRKQISVLKALTPLKHACTASYEECLKDQQICCEIAVSVKQPGWSMTSLPAFFSIHKCSSRHMNNHSAAIDVD